MKMPFLCFSLIFSLSLMIWGHAVAAEKSAPGDNAFSKQSIRKYDPIEIPGANLKSLLGKNLSSIRLYAKRDGVLTLIPYQFDEHTESGQLVLTHGPDARPQDGNGLLDKQDRLVFMVSDLGERAVKTDFNLWSLSQLPLELTVTDPNTQHNAYCYLAYFQTNPPEAKFEPKVTLDPNQQVFSARGKSWSMEGMVNQIGRKVYKTTINKRFTVPITAGGNGENIFDRMKLRGQISLLFGTVNVKMSENNLIGEVSAYKNGPVRLIGRQWLQVVFPLRLRSPMMYMDTYCYDYCILIPMNVRVHFNPGYVITYARGGFGYDLNNNALGMNYYDSNNLEGFLINGRMEQNELHRKDAFPDWVCITGPQGTMAITGFEPREYLERLDKSSIIYRDDAQYSVPPEDYPGSIGSFHFWGEVSYIEAGEYKGIASWFFPPNFYDPGRFRIEEIEGFMAMRKSPLKIKIEGDAFNNSGGWPSRLK